MLLARVFVSDPVRPLILASASPRRQQLLSTLGFAFEVQPANIDESPLPGESAPKHVLRLAREKAAAIQGDAVVLAADTIVVLQGQILGKPKDAEDASRMLWSLSGSTHEVLTAIAVRDGTEEADWLSVSTVRFRELSGADVADYVATGEPLDKAGAYGIQGGAARFVEHLDGSYTGIMGLPLCQTEQLLRQFGCLGSSR